MRKHLCNFYLGSSTSVALYINSEVMSGSFSSPYRNRTHGWIMDVGIGGTWSEVLYTFIHECEEMMMVGSGLSYHADEKWDTGGSDARKFLFDHGELSEMNLRLADAIQFVMPQLKRAWTRLSKKKLDLAKKKRKRKAKKKKA